MADQSVNGRASVAEGAVHRRGRKWLWGRLSGPSQRARDRQAARDAATEMRRAGDSEPDKDATFRKLQEIVYRGLFS